MTLSTSQSINNINNIPQHQQGLRYQVDQALPNMWQEKEELRTQEEGHQEAMHQRRRS